MNIWDTLTDKKNEIIKRSKQVKENLDIYSEERKNNRLDIRETEIQKREKFLHDREIKLRDDLRYFHIKKFKSYLRCFVISFIILLTIAFIFPYFTGGLFQDDTTGSNISADQLALPENKSSGNYIVSSKEATVRLGPSKLDNVTNKLFKGQKVEVHEVKGRWARISQYYDGGAEGIDGDVARWINMEHLSSIP